MVNLHNSDILNEIIVSHLWKFKFYGVIALHNVTRVLAIVNRCCSQKIKLFLVTYAHNSLLRNLLKVDGFIWGAVVKKKTI